MNFSRNNYQFVEYINYNFEHQHLFQGTFISIEDRYKHLVRYAPYLSVILSSIICAENICLHRGQKHVPR